MVDDKGARTRGTQGRRVQNGAGVVGNAGCNDIGVLLKAAGFIISSVMTVGMAAASYIERAVEVGSAKLSAAGLGVSAGYAMLAIGMLYKYAKYSKKVEVKGIETTLGQWRAVQADVAGCMQVLSRMKKRSESVAKDIITLKECEARCKRAIKKQENILNSNRTASVCTRLLGSVLVGCAIGGVALTTGGLPMACLAVVLGGGAFERMRRGIRSRVRDISLRNVENEVQEIKVRRKITTERDTQDTQNAEISEMERDAPKKRASQGGLGR